MLGSSVEYFDVMSRISQIEDTWGDGGCWHEVLVAAVQRAGALSLLSEEDRITKGSAIADVLSKITGHHDPAKAQELCRKLEEILPLSR